MRIHTMDQDAADTPPTFGFQPPITTTHHRRPPIDPVVLILILTVLILLIICIFLLPILSHIPTIIKPTSFESTWNSLNVFLVLFAILCGVFASQNDDISSTAYVSNPVNSQVPESYHRENRSRISDNFGVNVRSSSTVTENFYPSKQVSGNVLEKITLLRSPSLPAPATDASASVKLRRRRTSRSVGGDETVGPNVPEKITVLLRSPSLPAPATDAPASVKLRRRRTSWSVGREVTVDPGGRFDDVQKVTDSPPPPVAPSELRLHVKHNKLGTQVSQATKEMVTKIASLDDQKKQMRKNKRKSTSVPSVIPFIRKPPSLFYNMFRKQRKGKGIHTGNKPPSPLPSPPPKSIFTTLFKSGGKKKQFHSAKTSPPPPPPPYSTINRFPKIELKSNRFNSSTVASPPSLPPPPAPPPPSPRSIVQAKLKEKPKLNSQIEPSSRPKSEALRRHGTEKPPLPTKTSDCYDKDGFLSSGSQSPWNPIPPPLPPFKMPAMKFELRGDFVKLLSTNSSVSSTPDREVVDFPSTIMDGGDSLKPSPISFCSPDVNAKADIFISRRKDEWKVKNNE